MNIGFRPVLEIAPPPAIAPFDAAQANARQEAWARYLGVPVEYENSIGMKFRLIPPGEFVMGSPETEQGREDLVKGSERQHKVHITRPFYLGLFEVTQGEYRTVMNANPSAFSADGKRRDAVVGLETTRFPVEQVSWNDAHEFCKKLSQQVAERGRRYRLPTEAEWEYAFRGGTTTTFYVGDSLTSHEGNFAANFPYGTDVVGPYVGRPSIVGSYPPNPFGLYDMIGNVCEWCLDACHGIPTYDAGVTLKDPLSNAGAGHVRRGGAFTAAGRYQRAATRYDDSRRLFDLGFRVVLEVDAGPLQRQTQDFEAER